ncbi:MAG: sugar-transfer associated ATP-grasp domain-containing protein [Rhizobiaceae bacterium]
MSEQTAPILDHMSVKEMPAFAQVMPRVAADFGKPLSAQLKELLAYCLRGNKLSVDEYYSMCLFDGNVWSAEEKKKVVGLQKSRDIWGHFLERNPWTGVMDDKLSYEKLLAGFGITGTSTVAIIGGRYPEGHPVRLSSAQEVSSFLKRAKFPLFGKPTNSLQSLGSARINGYDARKDSIQLAGEKWVSVADFWNEIGTHFNGAYLFQECVEQHPVLAEMCGSGVPTVRVVTLDRGNGPELFRVAIKLTGKGNVADNFWRKGNMLAPIDSETGVIGKALTGMGIDGQRLDVHPDTGKQIEGVMLPHWEKVRAAAIGAATLTKGSLIIGFDIAVAPDGPVIIEANYDPHLIMLQVAHQKGVLDEHMLSAMDYMKRIISDEHAGIKAHVLKERSQNRKDMQEALTKKAA